MNNSKEKVVVLNEDVCTEILLRLPVKSVTKFQLVCKRWFSIISTDHFRRHHTLGRPKPPPSLILNPPPFLILNPDSRFLYLNPINPTAKPIPFSIKLANNPKHVTILSCCNGLLLLECHGDDKNVDLFVYNPTTRQSRKLCLPHSDEFFHIIQLHLVFDPTISIYYKIICVGMFKNLKTVIEVLDSKSGTWNVCRNRVPGDGFYFDLGSASTLYCRNKMYTKTADNDVHSLDLDSFVQCHLGTPTLSDHEYMKSNSNKNLLHLSNGCLYFVSLLSLSDGNKRDSATVWTLQQDNCFSPLYNHRLSRRLLRGRPSRPFRFIPETSTLLIDVKGKIVAYSFLDKTYKDFLDLTTYFPGHLNSSDDVLHFGETLAPI